MLKSRTSHHHAIDTDQAGNDVQIPQRAVAQFRIDHRDDRRRRYPADAKRVAIRLRLGDEIDAQRRGAAGPIFDHHGLSQDRRHGLADDSGGSIRRTACGVRHDQFDRSAGIGLRDKAGGNGEIKYRCKSCHYSHCCAPPLSTVYVSTRRFAAAAKTAH